MPTLVVQRAHASFADGVLGDVEGPSKRLRRFCIERLLEGHGLDAADFSVEETGAHRTVNFYHRGDPGRIAAWRLRCNLAKMRAEMSRDAAQFIRPLDDEP